MSRRGNGISADLAQASARFEQWRRSTSSRSRIPDFLWDLAVGPTREHGLSRTATTLKVGYYDLKRRVEESALLQAGSCGTTADSFVELNPATLALAYQCTIEFEKPCGSRMRIELTGSMPDLEALGRSFWESR
jgi:hypothetical protein